MAFVATKTLYANLGTAFASVLTVGVDVAKIERLDGTLEDLLVHRETLLTNTALPSLFYGFGGSAVEERTASGNPAVLSRHVGVFVAIPTGGRPVTTAKADRLDDVMDAVFRLGLIYSGNLYTDLGGLNYLIETSPEPIYTDNYNIAGRRLYLRLDGDAL